MTLLVYAVSRAGDPVTTRGIDGHPLRAVASPGGLAAIVSDASGRPAATERALRTYEDAVEALMADRPVLPVRFGTTIPDESATVAFLSGRHAELTAALQRVQGAVEIGVRARWTAAETADGAGETAADGAGETADAAAAAPAGPHRGAAYLQRQLQRERQARRIADIIDAQFRPLAREAMRRLLPRPGTAVAASYLVDRTRIDDVTRACDELAGQASDDFELVCTGPWPPYSFAG